jgi:hypothetical protein
VVAVLSAQGDRAVEPLDRLDLGAQLQLHLLARALADTHLVQALQVRETLEIQDALDQLVGVLHLFDGLLAGLLRDPQVAPVLAHLRVDEVLIDGRELGGEDLVERLDDRSISPHGFPLQTTAQGGSSVRTVKRSR